MFMLYKGDWLIGRAAQFYYLLIFSYTKMCLIKLSKCEKNLCDAMWLNEGTIHDMRERESLIDSDRMHIPTVATVHAGKFIAYKNWIDIVQPHLVLNFIFVQYVLHIQQFVLSEEVVYN